MKINSKTLTTLLATFIVGSYSAGGSDISSKMNQAQESDVALDEDILKVTEVKYLSGDDLEFKIEGDVINFHLEKKHPGFSPLAFNLRNLTEQNEISIEINKLITAEKICIAYKVILFNNIDKKANTASIELLISGSSINDIPDDILANNTSQILAAMNNPDSDPISVFRIYADMIRGVLLAQNWSEMNLIFRKLNLLNSYDTNFPNRLIQKMLLKNPSEILKELHDLVDQKRFITLYIDPVNAILLLLLDPDLLLDNPSLFYSYQALYGCFRQHLDLLRNSMFDNRNVRKEIPIIEMIKAIIDANRWYDQEMIPNLARYLSNLRDALSTDKEYQGDKDAVIANIDATIKYITQV